MTDQPVTKSDGISRSTDADSGADADADADADPEAIGILEIRELVAEIASTLLDGPFDGITSVERTDDGGWRAVFEVVERSAVPDTQDIIGRYEVYLSATGEVEEYALQ
ncbi:MAG: gas vesicle protein GvpO, partial [Haloferacaceae archaeon]